MHFYKYQGTGNDFIIVDNRENQYSHLTEGTIKHVCGRQFGVGADGFMLLNNKEGYDFEMVYYNADGREGSMCGNGGRCMVQFAYDKGIRVNEYRFLAVDGVHLAAVRADSVWLKMVDVKHINKGEGGTVLNTGSPHFVKQINNLKNMDVYAEGRKIRYSQRYSQEGINVNFVEPQPDGTLQVRTYERGVENETYSCGTGVTAAALAFCSNEGLGNTRIEVPGGQLSVSYMRHADGSFSDIWLKGPAVKVFEGDIEL